MVVDPQHNVGIEMKRKELTETYTKISNWKNPLVSMVNTRLFCKA